MISFIDHGVSFADDRGLADENCGLILRLLMQGKSNEFGQFRAVEESQIIRSDSTSRAWSSLQQFVCIVVSSFVQVVFFIEWKLETQYWCCIMCE